MALWGPFAGVQVVEDKEIICIGHSEVLVEGIIVHILETPIKTVVYPGHYNLGDP